MHTVGRRRFLMLGISCALTWCTSFNQCRTGRQPLGELLAVEFDGTEVRVRVLADLEAEWNQSFRWSDIKRVCFEAGGMLSPDVVYVSLRDRDKPAVTISSAQAIAATFGLLMNKVQPAHRN